MRKKTTRKPSLATPRKPPRPFSRAASIDYATLALARPPTRKLIARVEPVGELIASFVIPAKLCLTTNQKVNLHWRRIHEAKKNIHGMMLAQFGFRPRKETLPGRPQVLVTRFTTTRPDSGAGWEKMPIDCLLTPRVVMTKKGPQRRLGLGFIPDDSDLHIDARVWWEPGPRDGFVLLRVFAGAPESAAIAVETEAAE